MAVRKGEIIVAVASGGNYTTAYEIIQPTSIDNTIAAIKLDVFGCELVQVLPYVGNATNINVLAKEF